MSRKDARVTTLPTSRVRMWRRVSVAHRWRLGIGRVHPLEEAHELSAKVRGKAGDGGVRLAREHGKERARGLPARGARAGTGADTGGVVSWCVWAGYLDLARVLRHAHLIAGGLYSTRLRRGALRTVCTRLEVAWSLMVSTRGSQVSSSSRKGSPEWQRLARTTSASACETQERCACS